MMFPHSTFHIPHSRTRGQATLGFIFVVASIIIAVSVSFVLIVVSLINSAFAYQAAEQASLAAHSGVEDALLILTRNKDFTSTGYPLTVGPSIVTVSVLPNTPAAGQISVLSKATIGTNSRQSKAVVTISPTTSVVNILSWSEVVQNAQSSSGGTVIASNPSGLALNVDGAGCTTPCSFLWNTGDAHVISASSTVAGSAGTQFIYSNWSDSGAMSHSITVPSSSITYTANFTIQYFLTTTSSLAVGGSITPISQWYNSGSSVSVTASSSGGYSFTGFSGALSGVTTPQNVIMSAPQSVTASFSIASTPWYAGSWNYRQAITIDHTKVASSTGTEGYVNFPILVSLASSTFKTPLYGGHVGNSDGSDILFTKSDGTTKLNHEIEQYSSSTGALTAWVQLPSISTSTDTVFYMYYGNAGVANQQNVTGAWNANYKGVWHLADPTNPTDATGINNGTNNGATAIAGQINGAASFASQYIAVPYNVSFAPANITLSYWMKEASAPANLDAMISRKYDGTGTPYFFDMRGGSNQNPTFGTFTGSNHVVTAVTSLTTGTFYYITGTFDGTSYKIYVNGILDNTLADATALYSGANTRLTFGSLDLNGTPSRFFKGILDEVEISNLARSADWIKTEYNNQSTPGSFESFTGEEVTLAPLTTIASNPSGVALTVDGSACTAPCSYTWTGGTIHTIAASSTTSGGAGTQYLYASWSDSGAISHSVTAASTPATYTASFTTQYFLTTLASSTFGGSISPISQWYNSGTSVPVSASTSNATYQFTGFTGALSGVTTPQSVVMSSAQSVTANFPHLISWYPGSWGFRQAITITKTKVASSTGTEGYTNFPVLVNVTTSSFAFTGYGGGHVGNADGSDILFTKSDGTTKLNHEIERYTSSTGALTAWVQLPAVSTSTDTVFYVYYGNAGIGNQQNVAGTWDANYKGVWHMANGTTLNATDSTGVNNGTLSASPPTATAGQMGGAGSFSGTSQYITVGNNASLQITGGMTIEAWINPTDRSTYEGILAKTNSNLPASYDYYLLITSGLPSFLRGNGVAAGAINGTAAPATGVWSQIAATMVGASGTIMTHYLNGLPNGSGVWTGALADTGNNAIIGSRNDFVTMFKGGMDEVRISNIARSADWMLTEYNNQSTPATFETFGSQEVQ